MSKLVSKLPSKMSKPLRVMFLAPHLSTGGMPQFLLKRIEVLQHYTNVEITVIEYQCHNLDFVVQRNAIIDILYTHCMKINFFKVINQFNPDVIHIDEMSERMDREMITKLYSPDRKYRIVETCHDVSFAPETKMFIPNAFAFCSPYHLDTFANVKGHKEVIEYPIDTKRPPAYEKLAAKLMLGIDLNKKHIINVGLWTRGKNQGEGLALARKLPHVQFHFICNQAGNFMEYWKPLMKNVPDNVNVWGRETM